MKMILPVALILISVLLISGCNKDGDKNNSLTASNNKPTNAATASSTKIPTQAPTLTTAPTSTTKPTEKATPTAKGNYSGGIDSADPIIADLFKSVSGHLAYTMAEEPVAIQFYATTTFDKIQLSCHNGNDNIGTVVFNLYEFKDTYDNTIKQNPIDTKTFVNFTDNASLELKFSQVRNDGEYLLCVTTPEPSEGMGVWYVNTEPYIAQHIYFENMFYPDAFIEYFKIGYTQTPKNLYGPLTAPVEEE